MRERERERKEREKGKIERKIDIWKWNKKIEKEWNREMRMRKSSRFWKEKEILWRLQGQAEKQRVYIREKERKKKERKIERKEKKKDDSPKGATVIKESKIESASP